MSDSKMIVVVAGANGQLGKLVCEALLEQARVERRSILVRGLVRKGSRSVVYETKGGAEQQLIFEPVDYQSDEDLARVSAGAHSIVSALQGLSDVIVGVQSRLLTAAMANNVRRFIPSDFALNIAALPEGANRNFDVRREFHRVADSLIRQANSSIEFTSIYQGGFMELLTSGWFLFDFKKNRVPYFGSSDTLLQFTTMKNTAEYTAAVATDKNSTPKSLEIAGELINPKNAQQIAKQITGVDFKLKRVMTLKALRMMISIMKVLNPGKKGDLMPTWVMMQYGYCMALGQTPSRLDNDRYQGIHWTQVEGVVTPASQPRVG